MKSSCWTLCFLALFVCFTRGTSENLDNEGTYLDRRTSEAVLDIEKLLFRNDEVGDEGNKDGEEIDTCDDDDASKKCQNGGLCEETEDLKVCNCKKGTSGNFCETVDLCKDKKCGNDATCVFDTGSETSICRCTQNGLSFDESDNKCKDTCDDDDVSKKCQNGGLCKGTEDLKFCSCKKGTSGNFCETVDLCKDKKCGNDATCVFDTGSETSICRCTQNGLSFDESDNKCKDTCDDGDVSKKCQNGGLCKGTEDLKFCSCKKGTSGNFCETVDLCKDKKCGNDATCVFDTGSETSICRCTQNGLSFDESDNKCKDTCDDDEVSKKCQNGGLCKGTEDLKFCSCKKGTSGNFCETVDLCKDKKCGNDATCVFDTGSETVICRCTQNELSFDESDNKCKVDHCKKKCNNAGVICDKSKRFEENVECSCEKDTILSFDTKDNKCKEDYCKTKCSSDPAVNPGVTCDKSKRFDENADCTCENSTKSYDPNTHTCKVDYCKKKCSNAGVNCDKSKRFDENVECSCEKDTILSFDTKDGKCKEDYCKTKCSSDPAVNPGVTCDKSKRFDENADCTCENSTKTYDPNTRTCKVDYCKKKCSNAGVNCDESKRFDENVECSCEKDTTLSFDTKDGKCKADFCKQICGAHENVKCEGDKFKTKTVASCKCKEEKMAFNVTEKECKTDLCFGKCGVAHDSTGDVRCKNGPFGTKGKVECTCKSGNKKFDTNEGQCRATCTKTDDCKRGTCEEQEGVKFCKCPEETSGDKCQTINDCEPKAKWGKCKGAKGTCTYDDTIPGAVCTCQDGKKPSEAMGFCVDTCEDDKGCKGNRECNDGLCECKPGYGGDGCTELKGCTTELKEKCKKVGATCVYDKEHPYATCKCTKSGYTYKDSKCKQICNNEKNCTGNSSCKDGVCECDPGYDGDECKELKGCTTVLKEKCKKVGATCVYDKEHPYATCECDVSGFVYEDEKCKHKFCKTNPCKGATCEFNNSVKAAYCKCPSDKEYYDYKEEQCKKPDACLLTKCEENEVCEDGVCKCENYDEVNKKCLKKDCDDDSCFDGAKCANGICVCEEGNIYANNQCQKTCNFKSFKAECECPENFKREGTNQCVLPKDSSYKNCTKKKDCGYGLCYEEENEQFCDCFQDGNNVKEEEGKCVLNVDVCASGKLSTNKMKCECTGIYKQAKDGVTCELVTCKDKILSGLCKTYNAACEMRWKDIPNDWKLENYCKCPTGYVQDKSKCIDECSTEKLMLECLGKDQFCYHSKSEGDDRKHVAECRCPPPIKYENGRCQGLSENVYMIKNIPIMKTKYVTNNKVDPVLLNMDIIDSLRQTYGADMFDYGYLHDFKEKGDVLNCNVWIAFKKDASDVKERIRLQSQKFTKDACGADTKCSLDAMIWPPSILMSESHVKDVAVETLSFCPFAKDLLCGENTECQDNKRCVCKPGFQAPTIAMRVFGDVVVQRCEDIDECATDKNKCTGNTQCENTFGSYRCVCKPGFKKEVESTDKNDKGECIELCSTSPCEKGSCTVVNNTVDCKCDLGYVGSFCNRKDVNLASAKKQVVVVGAVLGTILGVALIGFILFYRKVRKSSHSQDFTPAPRRDNAEMMERRPMRGVVNKSYE